MEGYRHHLSLIVEDDDNQRALLSMLLEESDMEVLECASAEAAVSVLDRIGESVCFLFTDVKLAGAMSGAALAVKAKERFPQMDVVAPELNYRFKHALIQDAAYENLLKSRRQVLHRRVAEICATNRSPRCGRTGVTGSSLHPGGHARGGNRMVGQSRSTVAGAVGAG